MRSITALFFKLLFQCKPLRYFYYGLYEKVFLPRKLFQGVTKTIFYKGKFKLNLDLNDWISQNLYFFDSYEEKEIKFLQKILNPGDSFIDAGANIGIFSLMASEIVGPQGRVYSFEPFSKNHKNLENHVKINNLKNVAVEQLALSDRSGEIVLHINETDGNMGMATAYPSDFTYSETVKTISLDDYVLKRDITLIKAVKIDIEGGEYLALLGMKRILEKYHPTIIIEINPEILTSASSGEEDIETLLKGLSYKKMFLDKSGELVEIPIKGDKSRNCVFI